MEPEIIRTLLTSAWIIYSRQLFNDIKKRRNLDCGVFYRDYL